LSFQLFYQDFFLLRTSSTNACGFFGGGALVAGAGLLVLDEKKIKNIYVNLEDNI